MLVSIEERQSASSSKITPNRIFFSHSVKVLGPSPVKFRAQRIGSHHTCCTMRRQCAADQLRHYGFRSFFFCFSVRSLFLYAVLNRYFGKLFVRVMVGLGMGPPKRRLWLSVWSPECTRTYITQALFGLGFMRIRGCHRCDESSSVLSLGE